MELGVGVRPSLREVWSEKGLGLRLGWNNIEHYYTHFCFLFF